MPETYPLYELQVRKEGKWVSYNGRRVGAQDPLRYDARMYISGPCRIVEYTGTKKRVVWTRKAL